MKSKAKNLLVKLTSLVLAVFLVLPSQVWAADLLRKDSRKYTANSSIMGLATQTSPDDSKESLAEEADRQTLLKANQATDEIDAYTIEKSATLSKTTKEITYQFIIKSKAQSIESEKKENIYAIFALNNNTDLTDIKVDKVTTLDESGKEIKATYQASNPGIFANDTNISTLGIRSEKQANDLLYYLSAKVDDEAIAKIEKGDYSPIFALDMVLANNEKKAIYENRYALEVNKYTEEAKSDERLLEIKEEEKLEEVEESKSLIKGEYSPETNGLFATNPATVTWTDYILSTDEKEFVYDIDLDKAQKTENSEISVEFYEAKENGFILNNSFSQKLPFANSIKLQIPRGQLARITLTTTINKEANAKEFTYNGKILANPDHKVDASTEDTTTEEKANDDPDPLPEQKEESEDKSKDKEKVESDKKEITLEADPETNEVIVDPDLIKEEKADKSEEEYSAIDLNRDSVIRKFQEEENADPIMEIAINNIASLFSDYNKEAISYDKLLASLKEQSKDIDKEDFRAIATGLLAGINKDNYKVANIEIDNLLDDIYGKETITEVKEEKEPESSSIENNTDDDIPTQTIDQNLDLDSLDTKNEADALSPEEKDKQKALESFDKALDQVKEESKKPQDDDRTLFGNISEGVKGIFGQSNLQKADSELKAALDEGKSLEEIQALLLTLGEKYELNRKDEAKLMADNEDAIKALIQRDADKNFRPSILMAQNADGISPLTNKKFTVRTIFETSTINGPVKKDQYFDIILDEKLTVKDPSTLDKITNNNKVIATPTYDAVNNKIRYQLTQDINENLSIPLNIDVDYNTANITPGEGFIVTNKVQGLGVKAPKDLVPQRIDKNGNPAGSIIEPDRDDVTKIIDDENADYTFDMDVIGTPVVNGVELEGMNWTITVDSDKDLFNDLGFNLNLTTVKGSGLGEIQDVKLNGQSVELTDQLAGEPVIVDSKHHTLATSNQKLTYTFFTPRTNKQTDYMLDVSVYLTEKKKRGAVRSVTHEGYPQDKVEDSTPNRVGMNNRTTILGEFKSESTAKWTVSDGITSADTKSTGLPWESRKLTANQSLTNASRYVYGISSEGKMEKKLNPDTNLEGIPAKQTNPSGQQATGNIAIYEFDTKLNTADQDKRYGLAGVEISKYKDIILDQHWSLADGYEKMPAQTITVKDNKGGELGEIKLSEENGYQRLVTIPNVRFWNIASDGKASMIDHKVDQPLPTEIISVGDKKYTFKENANYYDIDSKSHQIVNALIEKNDKIPATFTVIKVDAKNPEKRIPGANFYLLGAKLSLTTDANGEATFNNVKPGTYTLKETKAPAGYKLDQEDKTITISDKGEVSISGKNAQFSSGSGKTDILEHSDFPNWKDFMNTQHYGKVDENGDLKFYVYLKPYDQRMGGKTDKDTTFNISIPGVDLQDSDIKVYDVGPNQRPDIFAAMNNQNVDQKLSSLGQITLGEPNNNGAIEGDAKTQNPLSGNIGYQITFPQGRFGDNWGFLVEVSANIEDKDSTVLSYDWLAKEDPTGQSNIRANVNLSKNSDKNGHPTITISNEEFAKSPIEVAKFADTSTDGNKDRLGGAEFVLKNENGLVLANKVTNKDGKVSFGEYPTGKYYLEEVKAPDGYEKSNVYFKVTVDEKGQVSYDARFKNSSGTPTVGVDYYIERESDGQSEDKAVVTYVNQKMEINDDEGAGYFRGIWEAYRLESLKYHLDAKISNAAPGSRFEIQFDPNLDFTQYFKTFPNLYFKGKMIAEPYFDYKTNLLTYVFNKNSLSNGETTFSIDLKGMIPSKFYATHSGDWKFTNTVAPNQKAGTIEGNRVQDITVHADYGAYDSHETKGKFPSQTYYFRDVYKADDGNWYVTAIGYYNPLGDYKTGDANKIWFNWKFAKNQGPKHETWQGHYDPPYYLDDVKIYKTTIPTLKRYDAHSDYNPPVNDYMPLSMGVRPEQNPDIYSLVYHADIDHTKAYNRSQGGFNLSYEPNKVTSTGPLYETQNPPLTISVPKINPTKDAYLIEQTFRIRDIDEFNTHWRAFYMANGDENGNRAKSLNSFFVTGPNDNYSKADQTGIELPSFAKEVVGIINKKYQPASFKITKLDDANHNKKLQGATFELIDSDGYKIYRRSNQNGEVEFKDLAPGKYTLKEYRAPEGYIKSTKEWKVTVYSDGNVKITSTSIIGGGEEYTGKDTINIPVTNKPAGKEFKVYKKDADGKPLAGAKFRIYDPKKEDDKFPIEATSDPNGVVNFNGQPQENKDYILEEVEPPAGYKPLDKKWVIRIENGKTKIYTYSKSDGNQIKSILGEAGTHWVNVKERPTTGWTEYDNRRTGWAANSSEARYLGTRIVAINKDENYVIQRYVINPESRNIGQTTASIHRQSPYDPNMDWYDESNFDQNKDIKIFTLDKPVSGLISDIRLADYNITDISSKVSKGKEVGKYNEPDRLKLSLPETDKPIVVDIKVKYQSELGGVGTGMDWIENNNVFWKSDYYERVSDIVPADPTKRAAGSIIGSYVAEGSLDVTNELKTYGFKIKKVKYGSTETLIPGAKFKLIGPDPSTEEREMTTGSDGMIYFNGLKPGKYELEETEPAPGYEKTDTKWTVIIDESGKASIKEEDYKNTDFQDITKGDFKITNKQTGLDFKIIKRDNYDRRLEKAEFELERYTDKTYENKDGSFQKLYGVSDQNGYVTLKDKDGNPVSLPVGFYRLTETKSPSGYKKPQAPFDIEVYEEAGQLKAKYKGPEHTSYDYINNDKSYDSISVKIAKNGIKYKSKLVSINTESKTYVQRIYIDTREYTGRSDKINIQITPKYKREEIDFVPGPGGAKPPKTIEEGVKTAYRSTYKITGAPNDDNFADTVLNNYDLSRNDVTMLNTARWRPFDWGFDEDIMNLKKGEVYYIDVEGFYDDAILTGIDSQQDNKNTIPEADLKKLELNFDFYDGARSFQQLVNKDETLDWTNGEDLSDSYLGGNIALGYVGTDENGSTVPTTKGKLQPEGQKYPNWLSKYGGRIEPSLKEEDRTRVSTSIDLQTLYSSKNYTEVPQEGMSVINEEERYNVTFSKHGRDNINDKVDSENVTTNRLEGAIFKLQKEIVNTYVDVPGSYVGSAFNGYFGFRNLEPGRYRLMEVKAPEGYKPITDPLLYFTIKTVKVNTGEVVDPESGDIVDIKTVNVRFESKGTTYNLSELQMVDPKDSNNKLNIKDVDSKDIDIETSKIVNPDTGNEVLLKDMIVVGEEQFKEDGSSYYKEYPVKDIKIVPGSSGYISLEYNEANGVYQYLPEKSTSEKDGKLIDFVTSATAKNMGKIINEKPGQGKVKITKVAQVGNEIKANELLPGAKFKLTRLTEKEGEEEKDLIKTGTVGEDGILTFDELPIGNYRLEEIESPEGYINTNQVWHFTVGGEGLDPYAGPIARTGRDLSDKITLETIKASVLNPDTKTSTDITPQTNEIHPHWGESIEFTNKFTLAPDIKINPGDYFTLKMSEQLDLNGIFEKRIDNLDIIAPGVGTIAKADYDRENRIITYTFTEYANTYTLVNFSNKLTAFIDLYKVKQSDREFSNQKVGFGIKVPEQPEEKIHYQYRDIKVVYDLDFGEETDHLGNSINLVSKIVKYNPETGEFLHYYYVNRKQENTAGPVEFRYESDQELENLNVSVSYVRNYGNVEEEMPESFGVNENSSKLSPFDTVNSLRQLEKGDYTRVKFDDGIYYTHNYIIKVTGRVAEEDKTEYTAHGTLYKFNDCYYPTYAERHDAIRYFVNQATAKVTLEITAVNPENKIVYKKVDQSGKAVPGAKFTLKYKAKEEDEYPDTGIDEKSGEDGLVTFKKLKPGFYQLVETLAPTGYLKLDGPVEEFKVDKYGKIIRKETIPNPVGGSEQKEVEEYGVEPIYITNKKEHEIEFKKVDETDKRALEGAEFEVLYKPGKDGDYAEKDKLQLYEKTNDDGSLDRLVLKADEKAPEGYSKVDVFTSDKDGIVKFTFYEPGYYALKETKAPKGYMTPKDYVYEFRLENGKVQVLKNNVDKVTTKDGYLVSQVLKVNDQDKTFKQRIIIYSNKLGHYYKNNSYLRIVQNGWKINDNGQIKVAKWHNDQKVDNLPENNYVVKNPSVAKANESMYYLKDFSDYTAKDKLMDSYPIVVEFTGTIDDANTKANITTDLIVDSTESGFKEENITFMIDSTKKESQQSAYRDKYKTSIVIKNKKSTFPLTGGTGTKIAFAIIGTAVMLAAIAYFGIFQNDKNRRRSARYKK